MDPKNILKGRIGEGIFEALFSEAGHEVCRYGQEWGTTKYQKIHPRIFEYRSRHSPKKPDFVIKDKKGAAEGIEVKLSLIKTTLGFLEADGTFNRLKRYWPGTRIFLIKPFSETMFQVLEAPYLDSEGIPFLRDVCTIENWNMGPELISKYSDLLRKFPLEELR